MVKQFATTKTKPTLRSTTAKKNIEKCDHTTLEGANKCKKSLCENMRQLPVSELRSLAKILGVPQSACIKREYLCEALDSQITTFFSLKQFSDGSKNLQNLVRELIEKSGKNGKVLKASQSQKFSSDLLTILLLALEKYNDMVSAAFQVSQTNKKSRNEKLVSTATEANVYLRSALLGIAGSYIDPTYFRKFS